MSYSADLVTTGIKMLGSLAIVMGGMFVVFHFIKKFLNQKVSMNKEKLNVCISFGMCKV